ncbi:hypothetical protein [Paraburkholderia antibiotica]|uniref:Uncharacterized protein n=1 Tax=Paraburkholderia antibiotica TaxID=2728839 RepID=A0A7Y0A162_9BURK|nr:hypothetical protein [Paraburkholderia antibiotica]NML34573.1 hypothetical protein [Paraburkholderia antibiotica]
MQADSSTAAAVLAELRVDGVRLWGSRMRLARIDTIDQGDIYRLALTELDRSACDLSQPIVVTPVARIKRNACHGALSSMEISRSAYLSVLHLAHIAPAWINVVPYKGGTSYGEIETKSATLAPVTRTQAATHPCSRCRTPCQKARSAYV